MVDVVDVVVVPDAGVLVVEPEKFCVLLFSLDVSCSVLFALLFALLIAVV